MLDPQANLPGALQWGIGDQKIAEHRGINARVADAWRDVYPETAMDPGTLALWHRLRG